MEVATFLVFAVLAVVSALVVVLHRNPVYSVMSLVVTFISTAVLFVLLGAPLLAALQVLVYTGAILVLFLFVIMLLNVGREPVESGGRAHRVSALLAALLFGGLLVTVFEAGYRGLAPSPLTAEAVALKPLARELLSTFLLPFEIVGLLLLAAVVAATVLAARRPPPAGDEG